MVIKVFIHVLCFTFCLNLFLCASIPELTETEPTYNPNVSRNFFMLTMGNEPMLFFIQHEEGFNQLPSLLILDETFTYEEIIRYLINVYPYHDIIFIGNSGIQSLLSGRIINGFYDNSGTGIQSHIQETIAVEIPTATVEECNDNDGKNYINGSNIEEISNSVYLLVLEKADS